MKILKCNECDTEFLESLVCDNMCPIMTCNGVLIKVIEE